MKRYGPFLGPRAASAVLSARTVQEVNQRGDAVLVSLRQRAKLVEHGEPPRDRHKLQPRMFSLM